MPTSNDPLTSETRCRRHLWYVMNQKRQEKTFGSHSLGMQWRETMGCYRCKETKQRWIKEPMQ